MKRHVSRPLYISIVFSLVSLTPVFGQWSNESFTPPRSNMAAASVGTKVIFAGGITYTQGGGYADKANVNIYDNATDTWTTTNLSSARHTFAAASAGNKAFFAGGGGPGGKVDIVDVYNNTTGAWTVEHLSRKRWALAGTSLGSKVYFGGGFDDARVDVVDIYDTNTSQWTTDKLSEPNVDLAATSGGTKVYFAGGNAASGKTDNIDVFDTSTGTWSKLTLSEKRSHLAAASVGNKVLFAGGLRATNSYSDKVDIFDVTNNDHTVITLTQARAYLTATVLGTKVFFAGGFFGTGSNCEATGTSDVVDIYDSTTGTITSTARLSTGRWILSSASVEGKAVFAGGSAGSGNCSESKDVVDFYDPVAPIIVSVSPTDNSNGISKDTNLTITFNERIQLGTGSIIIKVGGVVSQTLPLTAATINGKTITIDPGEISGAGAVSIEIAPSVIQDRAGNNFAGITSADDWTWNFSTLTRIVGPAFPSDLDSGESVTVTVEDASKVTSASFFYRGISEKADKIKEIPVTATGNNFTIIPDMTDKIGVTYWFELTDISGPKIISGNGVSHFSYDGGTQVTKIPNLKNGSTESSYQIIAVPLALTQKKASDVFKILGEYNKKKWRLFEFNGTENREGSNSTSIEPGKGYWLITRNEVAIDVGAGKTVSNSEGTHFTIPLNPGWNLIGNPFNFTIGWSDVLNYNASADVSALNVFTGGTALETAGTLSAYRGAFVRNNSSSIYNLKIPVTRNETLPGRLASVNEIDFNSTDWQLSLTLSDGVFTNSLGGFGMHKKATQFGKDKFDAVSVPMLDGIGMFEMVFPHPEVSLDFSKEIVPSADSYEWAFDINRGSDKPLTLTWDNTLFMDSDQELFLVDPSVPLMRSMKTTSEYTLPQSTHGLRVIFGSQAYISQKMDEYLPLFDTPYPNPADSEVTIPFRITDAAGKREISIKVFTMLGSEVTTLTEGVFHKGSHEVVWNTEGRSGMYLIQMQSGDEKKWAKVLVH